MTTYRFGEHPVRIPYTAQCASCNRQMKRVASSFYTLNPFNAHRTHGEIRKKVIDEVKASIVKKQAALVTCRTCERKPPKKAWNGGSSESAMQCAREMRDRAISQGATLCGECNGEGGTSLQVCIQCHGAGCIVPPGGLTVGGDNAKDGEA